jgi:hypothetical protein
MVYEVDVVVSVVLIVVTVVPVAGKGLIIMEIVVVAGDDWCIKVLSEHGWCVSDEWLMCQ